MIWNVINTVIALLSLSVAIALWFRTVLAEHPIVDFVPRAAGTDGNLLEIDLQVRNPGERVLILHDLAFSSPPRAEVGVTMMDDSNVREVIRRSLNEQRKGDQIAELGLLIQPRHVSVIRITLPDMNRSVDFRIRWSKQTPILFPWWPQRVRRTPKQLRQMATAAGAAL